jgi:hypothetical protein
MLAREHAYQILDTIFLEIQEDAGNLNKRDLIYRLKQKGVTLSDKILVEALLKLHEDGYVRIEKHQDKMVQTQPIVDYFFTTIKGEIFEGYAKEAASEASDEKRLATIERLQFRMTKATLKVNTWIMCGTVGAAIATSLYFWWTVFAYGLDKHWWYLAHWISKMLK